MNCGIAFVFLLKSLPVGEFLVLPALEVIRMNHLPAKAFQANAKLEEGKYSLHMPALERELIIYFSPTFPITLKAGKNSIQQRRSFSFVAKRIHTDRRQYWRENDKASTDLRTPFKLD